MSTWASWCRERSDPAAHGVRCPCGRLLHSWDVVGYADGRCARCRVRESEAREAAKRAIRPTNDLQKS